MVVSSGLKGGGVYEHKRADSVPVGASGVALFGYVLWRCASGLWLLGPGTGLARPWEGGGVTLCKHRPAAAVPTSFSYSDEGPNRGSL